VCVLSPGPLYGRPYDGDLLGDSGWPSAVRRRQMVFSEEMHGRVLNLPSAHRPRQQHAVCRRRSPAASRFMLKALLMECSSTRRPARRAWPGTERGRARKTRRRIPTLVSARGPPVWYVDHTHPGLFFGKGDHFSEQLRRGALAPSVGYCGGVQNQRLGHAEACRRRGSMPGRAGSCFSPSQGGVELCPP